MLLLNTPLVLASLLTALVDYKMGKYSRRKLIGQTVIWFIILTGLAAAQPIYQFLFSNKLTATEPLSLFDVIQITGIISVLFIANRARIKIETLDRRVQDLHQELSIRMSEGSEPKP